MDWLDNASTEERAAMSIFMDFVLSTDDTNVVDYDFWFTSSSDRALDFLEDFAQVENIKTSTPGLANCNSEDQVQDPKELLPQDTNSEWARLNPVGQGDLSDVNLLKAGHHIGINTVGQSLRNANRQLRSEPPNPQVQVSPWLQSTIEPDTNRRPLEIA